MLLTIGKILKKAFIIMEIFSYLVTGRKFAAHGENKNTEESFSISSKLNYSVVVGDLLIVLSRIAQILDRIEFGKVTSDVILPLHHWQVCSALQWDSLCSI